MSSAADDNPFAGARVQPTGKVSVKLPVDDWLCRKMSNLNLNITEGYPIRNTNNTGLLRDQFIKPPRSSRWYGMHAEKSSESSTVRTWSHHTDTSIVSILMLQVTSRLAIRTGNRTSLLGDRSKTSRKQGKVVARPQRSPRSRLRVPSLINENHCVNSVSGQKNSVGVIGQGDLDPAPVVAWNSKVTLNLNVDFCVANAHIVTGLPQRKGVNPNACHMYTEIKYVKDVSCVGHLSSVNLSFI